LTVVLALTLITLALELQVLKTLLVGLLPSLAVITFVLFNRSCGACWPNWATSRSSPARATTGEHRGAHQGG
jgi:hypothetical protein